MAQKWMALSGVWLISLAALGYMWSYKPYGILECERHIHSRATGPCTSFQSSQTRGPISPDQASTVVDTMTNVSPDNIKCPIFMTHYKHPLKYWIPESSWSHPANSTCEDGVFCNTTMLQEERNIGSFYRHQHPADCSRAKFLVIEVEWPSGFGSTIHVKATMLLLAAQSGRVLIDSPNITWSMTNPKTCKAQDWSCYFAPLTNCTLPHSWRDAAKPYTSPSQTEQYVTSASKPHAIDNLGQDDFRALPRPWWFVHATLYLIRPNRRTLSAACFLWNCLTHDKGEIRKPYAAMFIRGGDKWKEAKLREPFEYFDLLGQVNNTLSGTGISSVYLGTDDARIMSQTVREFGDMWSVFWIGYHRDIGGLEFQEVQRRYHSSKTEWQILLSLADLYVAATADFIVGTASSNWCRLVNELRLGQGKIGGLQRFVSLDKPLSKRRHE